MFLSKLWSKRGPEGSQESSKPQNEGAEHLVPDNYFSAERCADLQATFERIGLDVDNITQLNS